MRAIREITAEEENYRFVPLAPDLPHMQTSRRDPVEPEPVGTIVLMAFRVTGYDPDCDGSLMARLECIDKNGVTDGWRTDCIGLYPGSGLVVTLDEWREMMQNNNPALEPEPTEGE